MTDRTIIGQKIAELRKEKGLTQAELADQLGVTHQAVSQWERSETLPDILTLPKIAEIFGESLNSLLGMETEGPSFPEDKAEDPDRDKAPAAGEEVPGEEGKPQKTTIMEDEGVHDTADEPEPTVEDAGDSYRIQLPPITIPGIPAIELPLINIPKAGGAGNPNSDIADRLRESQEKARRQAEAIREEARRSAEAAKKQAEAIRAEAMHSAEEARKQAEAVREDMLF
ncbi:MAG: helix-turn-helix transcriptional regulator, partial [Clostridia bacterium]|nr:helix-turn-helix transcriptional regulator [Clostridia bacterium]